MQNIPMPIKTPRLLMRLIREEDGQIIYDYKCESWEAFLPWHIWTMPPSIEERTVADDDFFCQKKVQAFEEGTDIGVLAFNNEGTLVCAGGLHHCDWEAREFTLGFSVRTSETKKGYATEMATALTSYAFTELNANKVMTFHAEGNTGSQRVIEKAGFNKECVKPKAHRLSHGLVDEHHYSLTQKDS